MPRPRSLSSLWAGLVGLRNPAEPWAHALRYYLTPRGSQEALMRQVRERLCANSGKARLKVCLPEHLACVYQGGNQQKGKWPKAVDFTWPVRRALGQANQNRPCKLWG
jgi:hypothetical protein